MHLCSLEASVSSTEKVFTLLIAFHMNILAYISTSSRHEPLYMCAMWITGQSSPYLSVHMHNMQHQTSSHMLQFEQEIGHRVNSPFPHSCSYVSKCLDLSAYLGVRVHHSWILSPLQLEEILTVDTVYILHCVLFHLCTSLHSPFCILH